MALNSRMNRPPGWVPGLDRPAGMVKPSVPKKSVWDSCGGKMNQQAPLACGLASLLSTHAVHSAPISGALKIRFGFLLVQDEPEGPPCIWACKPAQHLCRPVVNKARVPQKIL